MPTKHLLTISSLLLPLVASSATAQAGSTISDKSYWPSEARQTAPLGAESQADANSAFAYDRAIRAVRRVVDVRAHAVRLSQRKLCLLTSIDAA
jgi:hypothetical protein